MIRKPRLKKRKTYVCSAYKLKSLWPYPFTHKLLKAIKSGEAVGDVNEEFENYGAYLGDPNNLSKKNKDGIVTSKISSMKSYLAYCHLENFKSACIHAYTAQKDSSYLSKLKRTLLDDIVQKMHLR